MLLENGDGELRLSITYDALIAAFGYACDPILVLAVKSIDKEASVVHEVKCVDIGSIVTEKVYVWEIGLFR